MKKIIMTIHLLNRPHSHLILLNELLFLFFFGVHTREYFLDFCKQHETESSTKKKQTFF